MEQDRLETGAAAGRKGRKHKRWILGGSIGALALAGIGAAGAMGGGFGHPMMHGGHLAGRGIAHALEAVEATAEQEERIWAILDGARAELRPMMREFRDAHGEAMQLLAAPEIDRAAVEALRAERMAAMDEASKRLVAAALDVAEVLTAEQRAELAEKMKERRGWRRW